MLAAAAVLLGAGSGVAAQWRADRLAFARKMARERVAIASHMMRVTSAQRSAAAGRLAAARAKAATKPGAVRGAAVMNPLGTPDYFGVANYANSPLPKVVRLPRRRYYVASGTGIRKFVDSLPGLGRAGRNDLGQYIPIATPDTVSYPGSDFYVIGLRQYAKKMHKDLPATTLRGYVQLNNGTDAAGHNTVAPAPIQYLGPLLVAQRDRPVRVLFKNQLPAGNGGNLFLPVDTTIMGAGQGPLGPAGGNYAQNRATLHLHGGATPWISDGTPHQWTTPAGETTAYPKGVSVKNVPDMWFDSSGTAVASTTVDATTSPGPGAITFYYTNQQSARLMFYHDHSYGITRLNVYAGEAAPYLLTDPVDQELVKGNSRLPVAARKVPVPVKAGTIPSTQIPLVIQDKTFVPDTPQLAAEDPTWDIAHWGGKGSLWLPHVYVPNQNPADPMGVNAMGRWDYAFWFYPPLTGILNGPVANPLFGAPGQNAQNPGTPNPSIAPESFMDTPVVNGTAYPYLKVGRKAYRFRILNASDDRTLNLQIYFAKSNKITKVDRKGRPLLQAASGEVPMVVAAPHPGNRRWPSSWPTDGRDGGVPSPAAAGPKMIQIGNEGGFLPNPAVLTNIPIGYEYSRRVITTLNVTTHTLLLGPAERADVIIDFSRVPNGSKLIMYNDAPAPMPGFDPRYDYYTGDPNQVDQGGAPSTVMGYGPNTRTVMQFQVSSKRAAPHFDVHALRVALPAAYAASQDKPIVPEKVYGPPFHTTYPNNYASILSTGLAFTPAGTTTPVRLDFLNKALLELFDMNYGRMNAQLGTGLPNTGPGGGAAINYAYADPPSDIITDTPPGTPIGALGDGTQIWLIEHQGVDTHSIHFHLFNVQLVNRIAVDGTLKPPDPNELGWKETIRMNPGESVIVALRAKAPNLPFAVPDSVRPLDPTLPIGAPFMTADGTMVNNDLTNFGWEYVWHCHLLGHEENDMMRPMVFRVP
jgi:FtsP/CotA-like multicopper oxidase with cupredoxin domain